MNDIETALSQIENFQFIHEHLFSSGQPTTTQLQLMKEYGVSTVINVALTDSEQYLPHEDKICLELGLNYIQVPISWETPDFLGNPIRQSMPAGTGSDRSSGKRANGLGTLFAKLPCQLSDVFISSVLYGYRYAYSTRTLASDLGTK